VWIDLGLYKNLGLFLIFSVEPLILYLRLKFRSDAVNAKSWWLNNVQLHFSVNLQETHLFIHGFSSHATVLTKTKQLPIGQWLNASGMHLVN
jgi:hypothetical protein